MPANICTADGIGNLLNRNAISRQTTRVVKNSLAKRALVDTECECVMPVLSGPVILGFSQEDPGAVA
ncbi:MAG: 50S ribosomal protein L10, partial [Candidatus Thioglobus sp.]